MGTKKIKYSIVFLILGAMFGFRNLCALYAASTTTASYLRELDGRDPNAYNAVAIYRSSYTYAGGGAGFNTILSTHANTMLHTVCITSAGAGSTIEIYNSRVSTTAGSANSLKIALINSDSIGTYTFDVYLSSGLVWWPNGVVLPHATANFYYNKP